MCDWHIFITHAIHKWSNDFKEKKRTLPISSKSENLFLSTSFFTTNKTQENEIEKCVKIDICLIDVSEKIKFWFNTTRETLMPLRRFIIINTLQHNTNWKSLLIPTNPYLTALKRMCIEGGWVHSILHSLIT